MLFCGICIWYASENGRSEVDEKIQIFANLGYVVQNHNLNTINTGYNVFGRLFGQLLGLFLILYQEK